MTPPKSKCAWERVLMKLNRQSCRAFIQRNYDSCDAYRHAIEIIIKHMPRKTSNAKAKAGKR
jgi:hypothetical protein